MHPYELERLVADKRAEYEREARAGFSDVDARRSGRVSAAVAAVLRGVADWVDGGASVDAGALGAACAVD